MSILLRGWETRALITEIMLIQMVLQAVQISIAMAPILKVCRTADRLVLSAMLPSPIQISVIIVTEDRPMVCLMAQYIRILPVNTLNIYNSQALFARPAIKDLAISMVMVLSMLFSTPQDRR